MRNFQYPKGDDQATRRLRLWATNLTARYHMCEKQSRAIAEASGSPPRATLT